MLTALENLILSNLKGITLHLWRSSRSLVGVRVIILVLGFSLMTDRRAISDDAVRWNQIQVIGTHNSCHLAPLPAVRSLIAAAGERQAEALDYSHPPLAGQFSTQGVRQIELDVFHDPEGGRYAEPAARKIPSRLRDAQSGLAATTSKGGSYFHLRNASQINEMPRCGRN